MRYSYAAGVYGPIVVCRLFVCRLSQMHRG